MAQTYTSLVSETSSPGQKKIDVRQCLCDYNMFGPVKRVVTWLVICSLASLALRMQLSYVHPFGAIQKRPTNSKTLISSL